MEAKRLAETVAMHEAPAAPSLLDEVLDVTVARYAAGKLPKRARRRAEPKPPPKPVRLPSFKLDAVDEAYDVELRRVRDAQARIYMDESAFFENRRLDRSFDAYVAASVPAERPASQFLAEEAAYLDAQASNQAPPSYDGPEVEWLNREPRIEDEVMAERARERSGEGRKPAGAKLVGFTRYGGSPLYKLGRWVICGICFERGCSFSQLVDA